MNFAPGAELGRLTRFGCVGLVTTLLDLGAFRVLHQSGLGPVGANLVSYSLGIALSFALNEVWTFRTGGTAGAAGRAARFAVSNAMGLALSTVLVAVLALVLPAFAAKVGSVPLVFLWNYTLARGWVFATPSRPEPDRTTG